MKHLLKWVKEVFDKRENKTTKKLAKFKIYIKDEVHSRYG